MSSLLVMVGLLIVGAAAWWSVFRAIPSFYQSRFRYRLWQMRDALVKEILDDKYEQREQPLAVVHAIERAIVVAPHFTRFRIWVGLRTARSVGLTPAPQPNIDLSELPSDERECLERWLKRLYGEIIWQTYVGGPSGWPFVFFVVAPRLPKKLVRLVRRGPVSAV